MYYAIVIIDIFFRSIPLQYEIYVLTSQHINTDVCPVHAKHCLYVYVETSYKKKENSVDMKDMLYTYSEMF